MVSIGIILYSYWWWCGMGCGQRAMHYHEIKSVFSRTKVGFCEAQDLVPGLQRGSAPVSYSTDGNTAEDNVYQLRMDLEMRAQRLGYEEDAFDHILKAEESSDTECDESLESETEEVEVKKPEIESAMEAELRDVVERQLDRALGDVENPFEQATQEFEGDVSAVRIDPGGVAFMEPDKLARNLSIFLSLFTNRFASQIKRGDLKEWKDTSRYHYLTDEEILESINGESEIQRAFRSDTLTRFAVITLEEDSYYRNAGLLKLRDCLAKIGIDLVKIYKASDSDQWQIFIFFENPIRSDQISKSLSSWMRRCGIVPDTAGVGVFPSKGSLTVPLQSGFEFLNEAGNVIATRNEITFEASLALFLADIARTQVCGTTLMEIIEELVSDSD